MSKTVGDIKRMLEGLDEDAEITIIASHRATDQEDLYSICDVGGIFPLDASGEGPECVSLVCKDKPLGFVGVSDKEKKVHGF